jgi:hypothetical protein
MDPVSKAIAANSTKTARKVPGRPFKKGQSGNPSGRPKKRPITEIYQEILELTKNKDLIRKTILGVLKSKRMASILMLREMAERVEGKVPDELQVTDLRDLSDEELEKKLQALQDARS